MKYFYIVIVSFSIFQGCTSMEYRKAIEDSQKPWGICSGFSDFGPINDLKLFKLSRVEKNDQKHYWLEGYSEFVENEEIWSISIQAEGRMRGSKPSQLCTTTSDIRRDAIFFSQRTQIPLSCKKELTIAPSLRASLQTRSGKWFLLDITCRKVPH